ncbi:nitrous oxide reductase family maturation protein NosD [Polaribacter sp. SA4-12]|uniref:nitrous oxide reductase family maturation protein NosD n=1 Tax=Polaribacter sp. SA4-12 TaxID=1312072 RepID=UPI000B3D2088|nr:nitrous oxide reductase family maturation protein NosD [Polaribacter sp. SA4-12]ARV14330.1 nitrous oxide reductase [Polaribacter sp. SA4-12]
MRIGVLLLFLIYSFTGNAQTSRIDVCSSCKVKSIKDAIKLAKDGDTILVKKGIYKESKLFIDKSIHLIGEDYPVIDAENKTDSVIAIKADNFSLSGFKIKNIGMSYIKEVAGVFISYSKNFTIKDNIFDNVFYGIILQRVKYGLIKDNIISGNAKNESSSGNGVHVWKSKNMRIENNTVSGMRDGIYLEFVNNSYVSNNTSKNNIRYGLHFMFSHYNEYHHNEFRENGAGVAVMFSKHIKMYFNTFHYNWGTASYGLLLKEINDAEINDNIFEQNTIAINIDGCNRINYKNNHFIRNGWALKFTGGCYANIFEYNNFQSNAFDLSYNSRLNDNKFEANYWSEYSGYDLNKDGIGDVAHRPVKLFSYVVNKTPETLVLLRSLFVDIINFSEKVSPIFTPDNLLDQKPLMKAINSLD